jgi:hypothetical protein
MVKNAETNLNGRTSKPDGLQNGSARYDYSATRVGQSMTCAVKPVAVPPVLVYPKHKETKILAAGQFILCHLLVILYENCNFNIFNNMSNLSDILRVLILKIAVH